MTAHEAEDVAVTMPPSEKQAGSDGEDVGSSAGLTEDEKKIIDRQLQAPNAKVGYFSLFRYANKKEAFILFVATVASIAAGAILPLVTVSPVFNNMVQWTLC